MFCVVLATTAGVIVCGAAWPQRLQKEAPGANSAPHPRQNGMLRCSASMLPPSGLLLIKDVTSTGRDLGERQIWEKHPFMETSLSLCALYVTSRSFNTPKSLSIQTIFVFLSLRVKPMHATCRIAVISIKPTFLFCLRRTHRIAVISIKPTFLSSVCVALKFRSLHFTHPVYVASR